MAKYVDSQLRKDERIVSRAQLSKLRCVPGLIFFILCFICGLFSSILIVIIGILPLLIPFIQIKTTELAVTNSRILGKTGLFSRSTTDLHLSKIDKISVKVTLFGRIFNYSTISISGSGDGDIYNFRGIKHGEIFKNRIYSAIEAYQEEARLHQAKAIASAIKDSNENA